MGDNLLVLFMEGHLAGIVYVGHLDGVLCGASCFCGVQRHSTGDVYGGTPSKYGGKPNCCCL